MCATNFVPPHETKEILLGVRSDSRFQISSAELLRI
jgi:hypothetical protein